MPFLHITTRIEGHPYDGLLGEKGGTGFPTLMFLDGEGRKLMKHSGPRTPKGFEDSLEEVDEFLAYVEKAAEGDPKAQTELFIRQLKLEWFDYDEAKEKAAALEKVSKNQQKEIDQLLINTQVRTIAKGVEGDRTQRAAAGKQFFAMWEEDRVPSTEDQQFAYWYFMADYAEGEKDKKLFKKIVGEAKDALQGSRRYGRAVKSLEDRLDNFPKK